MARWAKLDERISEDLAVADLLEANPLACALFMMSLPRCDVYGILPGDARSFRARVCPAAELSQAQVDEAVVALVGAGLYHAYAVNGRSYIYVRRFHRYQEVRWNRVGPPEHPLPACWEEPAGYAGPAGDCRTSPGPVPDQSRTSPGPVPDQSGLARAPVDTDSDTDSDTEREAVTSRLPVQPRARAHEAAPERPTTTDDGLSLSECASRLGEGETANGHVGDNGHDDAPGPLPSVMIGGLRAIDFLARVRPHWPRQRRWQWAEAVGQLAIDHAEDITADEWAERLSATPAAGGPDAASAPDKWFSAWMGERRNGRRQASSRDSPVDLPASHQRLALPEDPSPEERERAVQALEQLRGTVRATMTEESEYDADGPVDGDGTGEDHAG